MRVCDLFSGKATDLECLVHDVGAIPDATFPIKTICRVRKVERPDAYHGMLPWFGPRGFYVDYEHGASIPQ